MVWSSSVVSQTILDSISEYPRWLVIAAGTVAAALLIWLAAKLIEFALWLLMITVIAGGLIWAVWAVFR
jgi:hypothetical protein